MKRQVDSDLAVSEAIRGTAALKRDLDDLAPYWPSSGQAAAIVKETHAFLGAALEGWQHCGALTASGGDLANA